MIFVRNVRPGDLILEEGRKCFGICENRASIAGQLCKIENLYFIKSKTCLYSPRKFDIVVGRIFYVNPDYYKVDLQGFTGVLPSLSFLNATKRNRPELMRGDGVIAQVVNLSENNENGEPLLCCKAEGLGKIDEAFQLEPWKVRLLYFSDLLEHIPYDFKIALAMNGFVYLEGSGETKREVLQILREFFSSSTVRP